MSTARQADRLNETEVVPAVPVRRSILHPASRYEGAPFPDWRRRAVTEELPAAPAVPARPSALPRRASRRTTPRRRLRCALVGTLLAVVAVTGLSAYAAQGVADAPQAAPNRAHLTVSAPR